MKKIIKFIAIALLAAIFLIGVAGCGNKTQQTGDNDVYKGAYLNDPQSFDYLFTMKSFDSWHTCNLVEGLMEYDPSGQMKGCMAKSWKVSDDGLTHTYKIRKAKWVTSEGQVYAPVTAHNWITGLQHAVKSNSEMLYIVAGSIKNLKKYIDGEEKDFSKVGIKAIDDHTLQYTLNKPETFWNSKTTYGILNPVSGEFLKKQGKDFGKLDPSTLLYNGPYILSKVTQKSEINYVANDAYWNKKNVHLREIHLTYDDQKNPGELFKRFQAGTYSQAQVFPNSAGWGDVLKAYPDAVTLSPENGFTYYLAFNYNRSAYDYTGKTDDAQKSATKAAIVNPNFRRAIRAAINKTGYNAQEVGENYGKLVNRNMFTPPNFVQTMDGESFGEIVQRLVDESKSENLQGFKTADRVNGAFSPAKAKKFFAKAKAELRTEGITNFPVRIDYPVNEADAILFNRAKAFKNSVEKNLGKENVVIDLQLMNQQKYLAITYNSTTAKDCDYDVQVPKWGADYTDPSSFLNVFDSRKGDIIYFLGIDATETHPETAGKAAQVIEKLGLKKYDALLDKANSYTDISEIDARYQAYAKAEEWLAENCFIVPMYVGGINPQVTKVKPFTISYAFAGSMQGVHRYKYQKLQSDVVTKVQYKKAQIKWEKLHKRVDNT